MHPRDATGFEWNDENVGHLAAHHITQDEAEEVFFNGVVWARNTGQHSADYRMMGWTDGGRSLKLIVTVDSETRNMRIITGWDIEKKDYDKYLAGRRRPIR